MIQTAGGVHTVQIYLLFYAYECFICTNVYTLLVWCPKRPEEGFGSLKTAVMGGCEPPHGC